MAEVRPLHRGTLTPMGCHSMVENWLSEGREKGLGFLLLTARNDCSFAIPNWFVHPTGWEWHKQKYSNTETIAPELLTAQGSRSSPLFIVFN